MNHQKNTTAAMDNNSRYARKETVWDRLSKVRKIPSSENLGINRSRQNLKSKPSQRFKFMRQMAANHQQQQLLHQEQMHLQQQQQLSEQRESPRRPLTPNSGWNRQDSRKNYLPKNVAMPEIDNRGYLYVSKPSKMVKEILNARSLNNSKTSSAVTTIVNQTSTCESARSRNLSPKTSISKEKQFIEYLEDSEDEYKLAPLMSSRSHYDLHKSSKHILQNFHEVLQSRGESTMEADELELVKNVIKYDERHRRIDKNNPELFKDILKTQLEDILKHENAVKQALQKLESKHNLHGGQSPKTLNEIVAYKRNPEEPKKLEVDVVFKNVPSLEREIIILRALGEKLEATLKLTASQRSIHSKCHESKDMKAEAPVLMTHPQNGKAFKLIKIKTLGIVMGLESSAVSLIKVQGVKRITGIAQEFRMTQKTLIELKQEANRPFYLPLDSEETGQLQKTSFKILKENPEILIRHIKSKDSAIPFNVLDHDAIFFNKIFFKNKNCSSANMKIALEDEIPKVEEIFPHPKLYEEGDRVQRQQNHSSDNLKIALEEEFPNVEEVDSVGKVNEEGSDKIIHPITTVKQRRRIRHSVTPYPLHKTTISPKNSLFKTILVGLVQISCFMLLIIAFTFPEVKC